MAIFSLNLQITLWGRNFIILHIFGWEMQDLERLKNSASFTELISEMRILSVKNLNWVFYVLEQFPADLGKEGKGGDWEWGSLIIKWPQKPQWNHGHEGDWHTLSKWNLDILPEGTTEWIIFHPVSDLGESLGIVSSVSPSFFFFFFPENLPQILLVQQQSWAQNLSLLTPQAAVACDLFCPNNV